METLTVTIFNNDSLKNILPGAPILKDITTYHNLCISFDLDYEKYLKHVTDLEQELDTFKRTPLYDIVTSADPHTELDIFLESLKMKQEFIAIELAPIFEKLKRRSQALKEIYDILSDRINTYLLNLDLNKSLSIRFGGGVNA